MASALGEVFDHGCDSITAIVVLCIGAWIFRFDPLNMMVLCVGG